ncbi:hypothetical protein [Parafrankia sp. BMG5.11]|uniref:hypothetical protein n=1 Tax=Parafrankia sp. BMG5.11 TaxID=222540 RepID=UPI001FB2046E|nr:hypothetical protein [Parafrankia sp. BMG5.11]
MGHLFAVVEIDEVVDAGAVDLGEQRQELGLGRRRRGSGQFSSSLRRGPVIGALPCGSRPARAA